MKLILNVEVAQNDLVNVEILDSTIEEIDEFTTCFLSKKELFDKIVQSGMNINYDFSKYNFCIRTNRGNILPVLYRDYSFITDSLKRRNASITIMKSDPERVYEYIENNHYKYLLKELPDDADERYRFDPIYGLSKLMEEKNHKADADYYNYFKKNIEGNYRTLRNMIKYILTEEEKKKIGNNISIKEEKVDFICTRANLILKKNIDEKLEKNSGRKYSICHEDDDTNE